MPERAAQIAAYRRAGAMPGDHRGVAHSARRFASSEQFAGHGRPGHMQLQGADCRCAGERADRDLHAHLRRYAAYPRQAQGRSPADGRDG